MKTHVVAGTSLDQTGAGMMRRVKIDYDWRLRGSGRSLEWSRHAVKVSKRPHLARMRMIRDSIDISIECTIESIEKPGLVMWHDRRASPDPAKLRDMWLYVCPCWQLPIEYARSQGEHRLCPVGPKNQRPDKDHP